MAIERLFLLVVLGFVAIGFASVEDLVVGSASADPVDEVRKECQRLTTSCPITSKLKLNSNS